MIPLHDSSPASSGAGNSGKPRAGKTPTRSTPPRKTAPRSGPSAGRAGFLFPGKVLAPTADGTVDEGAGARGMRALLQHLSSGGAVQDIGLALIAVAVISLMVLPMPAAMLDSLIATNIALSVLLMMTAMYVQSPLALSTFPTLLLFTTLLRLSLNIASTRSILLHAHAGDIIKTFGKLVIGGNVVVGVVVFLIIAIVQFIVIAKGSERVAEVGARFTLDAMPGKQMSIDAELRAGLIDKDEARTKRSILQRESQLYGAMDGAMKFVKGDAIAGLLIALVNILAGISIGVAIKGMPLAEAGSTYSILTVGDGLVSQIPSLFVSLAAGVLITRVAADENAQHSLSQDIGQQLTSHPKALGVTAVVLLLFMVVPGFPKLQFLAGALLLGGGGWWFWQTRQKSDDYDPMVGEALHRDGLARPRLASDLGAELINSYAIQVQLAPDLMPLARNGSLEHEIAMARKKVTRRLGVPFPGVGIVFTDDVPSHHYLVLVNEIPVASGVLLPDGVLAQAPMAQLEAAGLLDAVLDPVDADASRSADETGQAVDDAVATSAVASPTDALTLASSGGAADVWIDRTAVARLGEAGLGWQSADAVIGRVLAEVMRRHAASFVGIQEARHLLNEAEKVFPDLVAEATRVVPLSRLTDVLKRLVEEEIPLRNFREILQSLIEWGPREKDIVLLTEFVRNGLAAQITYQFGGPTRTLHAVLLSQEVEEEVRGNIQSTPAGNFLSLAPDRSEAYSAQIAGAAAQAGVPDGQGVVLIVSMDIRRYVKRMIEVTAPDLPVISYQDLAPDAQIKPIDRVGPLP